MLGSRLCLRAAVRPKPISPPASTYSLGLRAVPPALWQDRRVFVSTPRHRKDDARVRTTQEEIHAKQTPAESVKPENVEAKKPAEPGPTKNDPLLSEQTVSNKEQRSADWRIIKDMSHYLWPKDDFGTRLRVGLSVGLLVGAKVRMFPPSALRDSMLIANVGAERSNSVLFQDHHRQHEH